MVWHDTSNAHNSLTHYVNFLLGFAPASTTEFPLADKARSTNTAKYEMAIDIWRNADGWEFDDSGNSGLPEATANMVDNTQDVTLPTGALQVRRVEMLLVDGTTWRRLYPFDESNVGSSIEEFLKNKGTPQYYSLHKNICKLYPPPDTAQVKATAGLTFFLNREITEFTSSSTTSEIGFDELGDRLVAHLVAYDYAMSRSMNVRDRLKERILELKDKVLNHYANRHKDIKPAINPVVRSYE